jgi:hypothetical protein
MYFLFFSLTQQPNGGQGLLITEVYRPQAITCHSQQGSSGRVISPPQRPLPDKIQNLQQTDIHANGGIQTRSPSSQAAAELRLRPYGHWDRLDINWLN